MKTTIIKSRVVLSIFALVVILNHACVDLSAIRKFSEIASEANERFPGIAKDLNNSCRRQHIYDETREILKGNGQLRDIYLDSNFEETPKLAAVTQECKIYKQEEQRLIEANLVLIAYLKVLGDLAADDLANYDKQIDSLGNSFTSANIFNANEVNAVKGIAQFLASSVANNYRKNELKKAIRNSNNDVQFLASALKRIIQDNYILQLKNERDSMLSYYNSTIEECILKSDKQQKNNIALTIILIKFQMDQKDEIILQKIESAKAYIKILDNISKGHQDLCNSKNIDDRKTLALISGYGKTVYTLYLEFRKAF